MPTGNIVFYNEEKRFGFLRRTDGEVPNIFFHYSQWLSERDPALGERVRFDIDDSPRKPGTKMAFRVTPI